MTAISTTLGAGISRHRKKIWKRRASYWGRGLGMWVLAIAFLVPFVWMLSSSLKRDSDVFTLPIRWIPNPVEWANYVHVWTGVHALGHYFINSTVVAVGRIAGEVVMSSLAGYAFGRLTFRGRDKLFWAYLATTIVPSQLLLVPRFMYFREMGIYNTLWALILPSLSSVFGTFLLRQYFSAAPQELGDSARIDGANEWQVFWRIYLPLARPMLAAYSILVFVASWNDYEGPLIMLSNDKYYTLPLGLSQFIDENGTITAGLAMAGSVSSVVPVAIVFLLFQRQFLQAMTRVGLR